MKHNSFIAYFFALIASASYSMDKTQSFFDERAGCLEVRLRSDKNSEKSLCEVISKISTISTCDRAEMVNLQQEYIDSNIGKTTSLVLIRSLTVTHPELAEDLVRSLFQNESDYARLHALKCIGIIHFNRENTNDAKRLLEEVSAKVKDAQVMLGLAVLYLENYDLKKAKVIFNDLESKKYSLDELDQKSFKHVQEGIKALELGDA